MVLFSYLLVVFISFHLVCGQTNPPSCSHNQAPATCSSVDLYRTIDGSCNNRFNPAWGQSFRPHGRLLQPEYGENEGLRSKSVTGRDLPSVRDVSVKVLSIANQSTLSKNITNMVWLFGQFMDHDLTLTLQTELQQCCQRVSSKDCMPISISKDDPFWGPRGRTCMNLVRSEGVRRGDCGVLHREQLNGLTPLIDASNVYGSTVTLSRKLRAMKDGLMNTSDGNNLPLDEPDSECAIPETEPDQRCFIGGDARAAEWHGLTSIHTMFVRLHNKIAKDLKLQINPLNLTKEVKDEVLYQETRRIIGAILQTITYRDFLPIVMGDKYIYKFGLTLGPCRYNPHINPMITNAFATAAYRFGHSLVRDTTTPRDSSLNPKPPIELRDSFFQGSAFRRSGQDNNIRGVCLEAANEMDENFSGELTQRLFEKSLEEGGGDLPSFNTQRGRDHGLPPYNKYRKYCGLEPVKSFYSMPDHRDEIARRFASVYESPEDIDLFFGGVTEEPVPGGLVGPTFACIIGEQFKRLREGDRFWHENQFDTHSFTTYQIQQLKKITLTKVICDTTNSVFMPKDVFMQGSDMVFCNRLPDIDFKNWLTPDQLTRIEEIMVNATSQSLRQLQGAAAAGSPAPDRDLFVFGLFRVPV